MNSTKVPQQYRAMTCIPIRSRTLSQQKHRKQATTSMFSTELLLVELGQSTRSVHVHSIAVWRRASSSPSSIWRGGTTVSSLVVSTVLLLFFLFLLFGRRWLWLSEDLVGHLCKLLILLFHVGTYEHWSFRLRELVLCGFLFVQPCLQVAAGSYHLAQLF